MNFFDQKKTIISNAYSSASNQNKVLCLIYVFLWIVGCISGFIFLDFTSWIICTALLYMLIYFITLEAQETFFLLPIGLITIILSIALGLIVFVIHGQGYIAFGFIFWCLSLYSVYHSLVELKSNRIKFAAVEYFQGGAGLFTLFFTLGIVFTRVGQNNTFTLTCDELLAKSNVITNYISNTVLPNTTSEELSTQTKNDFMGYIYGLKKNIVDSTLDQQTKVNKKICETIINQISELYEKPEFKLSVIALLLLVISPLLRITIYLIFILSLVIFYIFKKLGKYKINKITKEIDKIDI